MKLKGLLIDSQTRCEHYHSELDIIAIKFKCCNTFYPCYQCHEVFEKHSINRWKLSEFQEKAILCGNCKEELSINEYMQNTSCPKCKAHFNPKCANHYHLYFDL